MGKATRIFLCRHGQTEWNEKHIFQGQSNSPLTALGCEQAKKIGEWMAAYEIDAVCCSILQRARDTYDIIQKELGEKPKRVEYRREVQEISLGRLEGNDFESGMAQYPEIMNSFWCETSGNDEWETLGDVRERASGLMKEIAERYAGKTVLVVTHGVVLRSLYSFFNGFTLNESRQQPKPESACICEVWRECGVWSIKRWNYMGHLSEDERAGLHAFL